MQSNYFHVHCSHGNITLWIPSIVSCGIWAGACTYAYICAHIHYYAFTLTRIRNRAIGYAYLINASRRPIFPRNSSLSVPSPGPGHHDLHRHRSDGTSEGKEAGGPSVRLRWSTRGRPADFARRAAVSELLPVAKRLADVTSPLWWAFSMPSSLSGQSPMSSAVTIKPIWAGFSIMADFWLGKQRVCVHYARLCLVSQVFCKEIWPLALPPYLT